MESNNHGNWLYHYMHGWLLLCGSGTTMWFGSNISNLSFSLFSVCYGYSAVNQIESSLLILEDLLLTKHTYGTMDNIFEIATLANGCFWWSEAIFRRLKGVKSVLPGYAGGTIKNPAYDQVCTGTTGHAGSIQIEFDPKVISFKKILEIFWHTHDPTTLNRQGNDVGTQYRSAIFYHNEIQKEVAEKLKKELEAETRL